jgi:hypothetical protein
MFPAKYKLGFYIPEDGILHSRAVMASNLTRPGWFALLQILANTSVPRQAVWFIH